MKSKTSDREIAIKKADVLIVNGEDSRILAANLWDAIRAFRKQDEERKEEVTRPLKEAYDKAKKPFDDFIKKCKSYEERLQKKMSDYDREQIRLIEEAREKEQARIDAANAKLIAKAEKQGKDVSEIALKGPAASDELPKVIETQAGTTQTRQTKTVYTPKNLANLIRDYPQLFDLNMARFNDLAKTGEFDNSPDVTVTTEFVYVQRR